MTYVHGDWYCKPNNEDETKEIIARAIASGATVTDDLKEWNWNDYPAWGVFEGSTNTGKYGSAYNWKNMYTVEELRKKFPLPGEQETKKWNGPEDGLPPAGTVCEHWWGGAYDDDVEIIQYRRNGNHVVFWRISRDCVDGAEIPTAQFRPLRTDRDKWVEAAAIAAHKDAVVTPGQAKHVAKQIYDAIKSGELVVPK